MASLIDCGLAFGSLASGAAVMCPNNICSGVNDRGQYVRYFATMLGAGYYAYSGPGTLYYSIAAAQKAGAAAAFAAMVNSGVHQEWGNTAYADANGVYSYTDPQIIGPPCDEISGCTGSLTLWVPGGTTLVGVQHTHPWEGGPNQFDFDAEQLMKRNNGILEYIMGPSSNGLGWASNPRVFILDPKVPSVCQLSGPAQFQSCK